MADLTFSVQALAAASGSLASKLDDLRERARTSPIHPRAEQWGRTYLDMDGTELDNWCRRVWWGAAAGLLVRSYLFDQTRQLEAFDLIKVDEWSQVSAEQAKGGVILAAAHIGPPKFAMSVAVHRFDMPLIYSNSRFTPDWMLKKGHFFQPKEPSEKTQAMVEAALHLRAGGLMFAAPDSGLGKNAIVTQAYNKKWKFAPGIAALARMMRMRSFTTLAMWDGNGIALRAVPIDPPDMSLAPVDWHDAWIRRYWETIKPIVASSPENLRFLSNKIANEFVS